MGVSIMFALFSPNLLIFLNILCRTHSHIGLMRHRREKSVRLAFVRDMLLLVRDMLHVLNLVLVDLQLLDLIDTV